MASKLFPLRVDSFSEERQSNLERFALLKVYQYPLSILKEPDCLKSVKTMETNIATKSKKNKGLKIF